MNRAETIADLRKQLMPLQGINVLSNEKLTNALWFLKDSFPNRQFPLGCVHEFQAFNSEDMAASRGFISSILSNLLKEKNIVAWLSNRQDHFPIALSKYALSPDQVLFIRHNNEKELLWAAEEFLKYDQLSALVAEFRSLDFTASRRFQLAVEKSKVTAFVLRTDSGKITPNSSVSRWQVRSIPSSSTDLPGVGFPAWEVDLQKIRNGRPAKVKIECRNGYLLLLDQAATVIIPGHKKAVG